MNTWLLILRILHIGCGVFWAGTSIYVAVYLMPAVSSMGPEGGKVMQRIAGTNQFPLVMSVISTLNIVSGILLIERLSGGFRPGWFSGNYGLAMTAGGGLALVAYIIGLFVNRPAVARIAKLGAEIGASGGPPSPAQAAELGLLRKNITMGTNYIAVLLGLCILLMACARYIN